MPRTNRATLNMLLAAINRHHGTNYTLDYFPSGGGYRVEAADGSTPFGSGRRSPKEMYDVLYFAMNVITHRPGTTE